MVEIIILKYNTPEFENKCVHSVIDNTEIPYHLTVFDNYPFKCNIGQLWNRLIRQSDSDYICLLNSDTIVAPEWLPKLLETFDKFETVGCVGPSTDNCGNQQKTKVDKLFVDFSLAYLGWVLSGFCLVFPKKVWEEVNGFPEDYGFYGQEVNFVDKVVATGYKQIWRTDVFVHHEGSASAKKAEARGEYNIAEERRKANERRKKDAVLL